MSPTPPLITKNLITILGAVYSAFFYGIYLITLGLYLHSLFSYKRHAQGVGLQKSALQPFSLLLLSAVVVLAVVLTTEMINSTTYSVYYLAVYSVTDQTRLLPRSVLVWSTSIWLSNVLIATLLSDAILIYRTWMICGRAWLAILLPLLTTSMGVSCFAVALPLSIRGAKGSTSVGTAVVGPALRIVGFTGWLATILTNVYCTAIIVWRLRGASASTSSASPSTKPTRNTHTQPRTTPAEPSSSRQNDIGSRLNRIARVVVDSGALNTVCTVGLGVTYLVNPMYVNCVSSGTVQVVGISFNLMAYRIRRTKLLGMGEELAHGNGNGDLHLASPAPTGSQEEGEQSTMRFSGPAQTDDAELR